MLNPERKEILHRKEQYGFNLDITVMGIDDDNPYIDIKTVPGKNKIIASDSVADIVPYSVGLTVFMDTIFPSFIGNVACAIHLEFPWYLYVMIFAGILATYEVINLFMMAKLNRVNQTEVLKNRE